MCIVQSALGWEHQSELSKHGSQTDAKKGFGGQFGVQKDHQDKVCIYMSRQLGNEVERQGKANMSTTPRTALSLRRAALGGIRTHDTLQSRQALHQVCSLLHVCVEPLITEMYKVLAPRPKDWASVWQWAWLGTSP